MPRRSFEEHFARVEKMDTGCWHWPGEIDRNGYGRATYQGRRHWAHRLVYQTKVGTVPAGKNVCHRCDNPRCVNPDHLFIGSQVENVADMVAKGRAAKGERHSQSKLTAQQVLAIRADTRSQRIIADEHGLVQQTISDIKRRKSWDWL